MVSAHPSTESEQPKHDAADLWRQQHQQQQRWELSPTVGGGPFLHPDLGCKKVATAGHGGKDPASGLQLQLRAGGYGGLGFDRWHAPQVPCFAGGVGFEPPALFSTGDLAGGLLGGGGSSSQAAALEHHALLNISASVSKCHLSGMNPEDCEEAAGGGDEDLYGDLDDPYHEADEPHGHHRPYGLPGLRPLDGQAGSAGWGNRPAVLDGVQQLGGDGGSGQEAALPQNYLDRAGGWGSCIRGGGGGSMGAHVCLYLSPRRCAHAHTSTPTVDRGILIRNTRYGEIRKRVRYSENK